MSKRKYKINYPKLIVFLIILILILFVVFKGIGAVKSHSKKLEDKNAIQTASNLNEENVVKEEQPGEETAAQITRESKATPLSNGQKSKNSLAVLMYHYFYDTSKGGKAKNSNWMDIDKFEEQLKYLKENDYYFPTWDEVADFVDGKVDLPKKSIVITMDDGHKSLYNLAIPLLDKYNIPATAFIITSKFDTNNLEKYKNSTIDFESHTHNMHRGGGTYGHGGIFPALSIEESVKDLRTSVEKLGRK